MTHRVAACVAACSLLGWLELPSEHVHARVEHGHDVEYVHRHVGIHVPGAPDHAAVGPVNYVDHVNEADHVEDVDHDEDATYLVGSAADLTRIDCPSPHFVALRFLADVALVRPSDGWPGPLQIVRVHAPPWPELYSRRGPPALAV